MALSVATVMSLSIYTTAFAGAGDAYLFGGNDSSEDIDTETEVKNVQKWINKLDFNTKIIINPTRAELGYTALNSDFLYVAGHGNWNSVGTGDGRGICIDGRSGYRDIEDIDFDIAQCVILAACSTGNAQDFCIGRVIYNNGADFVLGWRETVDDTQLADFTEEYAYNLYMGRTYMNAYTKTKNYLVNNVGIFDTANVFKTYMIGQYNYYLDDTLNTRSTQSNESITVVDDLIDERLNQHIIEDGISIDGGDYSELEAYIIENVDNAFSLDTYKIYEDDELNGVKFIDFKYEFEGIPTNYGLSVICINGDAKLVTLSSNHNKVDINNLSDIPTNFSNQFDDKTLFNKAIEDSGYSDYTVKEQTITRYFDVETNTIINEVLTAYLDEEGLEVGELKIY